jgi:hypothetical protein
LRTILTHDTDGTFSTDGPELTIRAMNKGRWIKLGDGYSLQFTSGKSLGRTVYTAHVYDPSRVELYSVKIERPGSYILEKDGYTYVEIGAPIPEPATA